MDFETLLASFALIILITALFRLVEQRPTQIYVHTCNGYNGHPQPVQQQQQARETVQQDDWSDSEGSEENIRLVAHVVVEHSDEEDEDDEEKEEAQKDPPKTETVSQ